MSKPVIGLVAAEDARIAPDKHMVNTSYLQALIAAGATPLVIPVDEDANRAGEYLPLLDGLLVPGGEDICPSFYGQSPVPQVVYPWSAWLQRLDFQYLVSAGVYRSSTCVLEAPLFKTCPPNAPILSSTHRTRILFGLMRPD